MVPFSWFSNRLICYRCEGSIFLKFKSSIFKYKFRQFYFNIINFEIEKNNDIYVYIFNQNSREVRDEIYCRFLQVYGTWIVTSLAVFDGPFLLSMWQSILAFRESPTPVFKVFKQLTRRLFRLSFTEFCHFYGVTETESGKNCKWFTVVKVHGIWSLWGKLSFNSPCLNSKPTFHHCLCEEEFGDNNCTAIFWHDVCH